MNRPFVKHSEIEKMYFEQKQGRPLKDLLRQRGIHPKTFWKLWLQYKKAHLPEAIATRNMRREQIKLRRIILAMQTPSLN